MLQLKMEMTEKMIKGSVCLSYKSNNREKDEKDNRLVAL